MSSENGDVSANGAGGLDFDDLAPVTVPVTLGKRKYLLREASEDAACKYRNASLAGAEISNVSGQVTVRRVGSMADVEPLLVSLCLPIA